MRKAGALVAAALLALALGAPGCKPSSLTPFGIGYQDYGGGKGDNYNGGWIGATSTGGTVVFLVGNSQVTELLLQHVTADCTITFGGTVTGVLIADGGFRFEADLTNLSQGRIIVEGRFSSPTASSGTYSFEGRPAGVCPTAGTGSFTANKTP